MGEIIISPWLVWLASIGEPIITISVVILILSACYLMSIKDESIPHIKVIIVMMVLASLCVVLMPTSRTVVRLVVANYVTVDTTDAEYEMLMRRVCNILGVKMK